MKKILALVLSLSLVLALCVGCGSTTTASSTAAKSASSAPAEEAASSAPAEEAAASAEASTGEFEKMTLTIATSVNSTDSTGKEFLALTDYVTEKTGGAVTFNYNWGSTLCSAAEELTLMKDGAVDLIMCQTMSYGDMLPLFFVQSSCTGTIEEAKEYFYDVYLNNSETAEITAEQFGQYNGKMLGLVYIGQNCVFSATDVSSIADLQGLKLGCQESSFLTYQGLTAVFTDVADYYNNLDRGVIDGGIFSFDGYVDMHLYEAAPYCLLDGGKGWGMPFIIREDLWETMSPELQQIFMDAAEAAADLSAELVSTKNESDIATMEAAGCTVRTMSEEDAATWNNAQCVASVELGLQRAEEQGITDQMITIQKYACEHLGVEWIW